jgi:hypothetical protein
MSYLDDHMVGGQTTYSRSHPAYEPDACLEMPRDACDFDTSAVACMSCAVLPCPFGNFSFPASHVQ